MRHILRLSVLAAAVALPMAAMAQRLPPAPPSPGEQCRLAISASERDNRLPDGLLHAIGRVESGRPDPAGRGVTPWPWTINAEGRGRFFATKLEAMAEVEALQARGVKVIDVGCLQVNLFHHPQAFATLDQAFDPMANARYAGLFLSRLQATRQDWVLAAAHYHSTTPDLAEGYRQRVMAAWPAMAGRLGTDPRRDPLPAWSLLTTNGEPRVLRWNGVQMVLMTPPRPGSLTGTGPRMTFEIIPFPAPPGRNLLSPGRRLEVAEAGRPR